MKYLTVLFLLAFTVVATSHRYNEPKKEKKATSYSIMDSVMVADADPYQQAKDMCAQAIKDHQFHLMEKKKSFWKIVPEIPGEINNKEPRLQAYLDCGPILLPQKLPVSQEEREKNDKHDAKHTEEYQKICNNAMIDHIFDLKKEHKTYWKLVPKLPGQIVFEMNMQIGLDCGRIIVLFNSVPILKPYPKQTKAFEGPKINSRFHEDEHAYW